jgi:hypothetical protein
MRRFVRPALVLVIAALATAGGVLLISGGDDENQGQAPTAGPAPPPSAAPTGGSRRTPRPRGEPPGRVSIRAQVQQAVRESKPARLDAGQRRVARAVRSYVAALNSRDGARACSLFLPHAFAGVHWPHDRGTCPGSLSASIGYRDPRGFPVYRSSRVARVSAVAANGADARITATIVTRFADNREPSVEDDVVYLHELDGRWLIAKPSATLYRAIGVGDIPPQVLAPP